MMKIRYIGKRCTKCRTNSSFAFPDNGMSPQKFLASEGWQKIKDRWVCASCIDKTTPWKKVAND